MPESSAAVRHRVKNFYGRTPPSLPASKTELDVLIERHQFIRDADEQNLSWEDALAKKTYDQLFKELAVCDLSRWREGKVAMRWRTASEVIDGKGHFTCANLRCKHHELLPHRPACRMRPTQHEQSDGRPSDRSIEAQDSFIPFDDRETGLQIRDASADSMPSLTLQELQTSFGYLEQGVRKLAEVKLKLCKRCARKMSSCSLSKRRSETHGKSLAQLPSSSSSSSSPAKRRLSDSVGLPATDQDPSMDRPIKFPRTGHR